MARMEVRAATPRVVASLGSILEREELGGRMAQETVGATRYCAREPYLDCSRRPKTRLPIGWEVAAEGVVAITRP